MKAKITSANTSSMIPEKPARQVPRMPAILFSCGVRPELEVSLPIQAERFQIEPKRVTTVANTLKSRSFEMSKGLRKLSPGARSISTGAMSRLQEKLQRM